jgi:putative ABC transport system permease protein
MRKSIDHTQAPWTRRFADVLTQDLRGAITNLVAHKGFSIAVIVAMALGIGANTAVFSVLNAVVLHPLPYTHADALVRLHASMPRSNVAEANFSVPEIKDLRAQTSSLSSLSEIHVMYFILLGRDEPQRVSTGVVSANYFETMGVQPLLGRGLRTEDDSHGAPAVLLLSYKYWQQSLGGDPAIVGRVFQMNDRAHTVIGVLPPLPEFPEPVDVYMPTSACPFRSSPIAEQGRQVRFVSAIARVGASAGFDRLRNDLQVVADRLQQAEPASYPARSGYALAAAPLQAELTSSFRPTLLILVGTAAFLLLVLCSSVAALLLARGVHRERETALRAILGASRVRLFCQFVVENIVLASVGALLGLAVAYQSLGLLTRLAGRFTPRAAEITIDGSVLVFMMALTVLTSLIFGTITTLAARANPATTLRATGTRSATGRQPVLNGLIVLQIAVSFALLIGAGLTLRSVLNLQQVDTGLQTKNVLTMRVALDFIKHRTPPDQSAIYRRLLDELSAVPGVEALSAAGTVPLNDGGRIGQAPLYIEGRDTDDGTPLPRVAAQVASEGYFRTVGIPVLQGRAFTNGDDLQSPGVAIINRSLARRYFADSDPVGHRVRQAADRPWLTIVGVVADARQRLASDPSDELYRPLLQQPLPEARFFARSSVPAGTLERQLRDAVHRVDPQQPVESVQTLEEARTAALASPRLLATLLAVFAGLALAISAVGIAGVIGFSVNQRSREFGVRMALGATARDVRQLVIRQGMLLAAGGLALGTAGALVLSRVMVALLFGVAQYDVLTFVAVAVLLTVVALAACFIPARRAASVDPIVALSAT